MEFKISQKNTSMLKEEDEDLQQTYDGFSSFIAFWAATNDVITLQNFLFVQKTTLMQKLITSCLF